MYDIFLKKSAKTLIRIWCQNEGRVRPGFSMERKERKFEFKHYEVLDKMSCVDGLEDLRTYKPQSIESQPNLNIKIPKHRSAEGENMLQT